MEAKDKHISNNRKIALYLFFLTGLAALYSIYIPCLMDYYIVRPGESFFAFFYDSHYDSYLTAAYVFEGVFVSIVLTALYCLTLRAGISMLIVSGVLFLLTHASYIKYINRRELLRLDDLLLTEAAGMAIGYLRFTLDRWLAMFAGGLLLFVGMGIALDCFGDKVRATQNYKEETVLETSDVGRKRARGRALTRRSVMRAVRSLGFFVLCVVICLYTDYFLGELSVIDMIESSAPKGDRYVLYHFFQNDGLSVVSVEQTEKSYDFLLSQSPERRREVDAGYPDVVVIMNESWWNTDNIQLGRVAFSQDPMALYKALADRCSVGYVTSPVWGGGTLSPEIEFLTGLNTKYYRADAAYDKLQGRKVPSVVDYFNGLGYETTAIHPYYGSFYGRDAAYAEMGFDQVMFEEDMRHKDIYTRYISDESLAEEIIDCSRRESGGPKFIWAVSVGNHKRTLDYAVEAVTDYDYPIEVTVEGGERLQEDSDTLVNYVNGIYLANLAFERLVDYFSDAGRPTVLLMFGDHCPFFSDEAMEASELSWEDEGAVERLYSTPVIMWSNFSAERLEFSGESIYYLPQMLIDYAGLPDSDMTRILRYERSYFQTNSPNFARDASGRIIREGAEEQMLALGHYKVVQYDILEGAGIGRDIWAPLTASGD